MLRYPGLCSVEVAMLVVGVLHNRAIEYVFFTLAGDTIDIYMIYNRPAPRF